jgi:hypothetical protein
MIAKPMLAISDNGFRVILETTLLREGELTVLHRLNRSAGRRDWFLVSSDRDIDEVLLQGKARDAFTFFLRRQFPIRGYLDDSMSEEIRALLLKIPEVTDECLLARLVPGQSRLEDCEGFGLRESQDLEDWLTNHRGLEVIAGRHPPLFAKEEDGVLTGIVPDYDGSVELGVY